MASETEKSEEFSYGIPNTFCLCIVLECYDILRKDVRIHVYPPDYVPPRIHDIVHTIIELFTARLSLLGSGLDFLNVAHYNAAQYGVPFAIICRLCHGCTERQFKKTSRFYYMSNCR